MAATHTPATTSTHSAEAHPAEPVWRDTKRYAWLVGAIVPIIPFLSWGLVSWTGWDAFWFFGPVFIFGLVPLVDLLVGIDPNNPPDEVLERLEEDRFYRWITYAFIPMQYLAVIWTAWMISQPQHDVLDRLGMAISLGIVVGIGINTAHELGHKKEKHERWLSRVALAPTAYGHFYIEHNRGHHVRVATPEDPASSRMGETVWGFLPRTVVGSWKSAWRLEKKRFGRRDQNHWTIKNDILNAYAMTVVLWGGLVLAFGWQVLPYLLVAAVVGIWELESVNYLEHYGMKRATLESGRYERVNPSHSWNSNNIGTNVLLYHLQRHSDHHANPTRRYQALRDFPEAPVLPTGYAGMIVLTWVPAVWRRVMDRRVVAHYDGDVSRANLHPRRAERYLATYGQPPTSRADAA
ncbi:alkane 1-monooxygenase [Nocardioides sp. HDW12B]|uniref:alkane 1-monooxygenase n=1 Tax=Nocardioides sp. HDW12B TaxID=2714939 RepID=UPI0014072A0C|nr:alkane 1-monooxygenase [Nocardioides sp. HDW12B]QIK67141.1 alkane 1-monooxygenase [Nocardioides sp. HDW12B]